MKVLSCPTANHHGYNVKFSPFLPDFLACATSENYGLQGKGALYVLRQIPDEGYCPTLKYEWPDGLFDVCWSNFDENFIATCSGDGSVQIWNTYNSKAKPAVFRGHTKEVYGVNWCPRLNNQLLLSASSDESIRLWDVCVGIENNMFSSHNAIVYSAAWSPHMSGIFASVGGDENLMLWDIRVPDLLPQTIHAHVGDVLTCDWSELNEHVLATGGIDNVINIWDLRNPEAPINVLLEHELAVRRVKFSPFHRNILASVSYDFSTRLWNWDYPEPSKAYFHHTEFVYGLDFSLHIPDKICDCGWDSVVQVYEEIDFEFSH